MSDQLSQEEKHKILTKVIQDEIINSGINFGQNIVEFGCVNNEAAFIKNINSYNGNIEYTGVDINENKLLLLRDEFNDKNFQFLTSSMQEYIDDIENSEDSDKPKVDWFIISNIFDKPIYEENQYNFLDTILRNCLENSNIGVSFTFNNSKSDKDYYNIDYITAYIHASFYRYKIVRFNENEYLITVYKYFLQTN